ncbi:hypothetical protein [Sorangium sp. So ce321]|uniref:hypothetical protein n=1 Tax=Sorangium sp. So ce321 TaxID=3133300 RepID=UPI003F5DB59F
MLPEATGRNCWDVGTTKSLTHDGGGDTQAIVQMVKYTLAQYSGDPERVYVMGGSSGAMMTQCGHTVFEAWSGKDGAHSMPYEHDAILAFFGLDRAGGADPETDCSGPGGSGGMGGSGGGGAGGDQSVGSAGPAAGSGGAAGDGGSAGGGATGGSATGVTAGSGDPGDGSDTASDSGGCAYAVGGAKPKSSHAAAVAVGLALLTFRRRPRNARR